MRQLATWEACRKIYVEVVGPWKPARSEHHLPTVEVRLVQAKTKLGPVLWNDGACEIPVAWLKPIGRMARDLMRPRIGRR